METKTVFDVLVSERTAKALRLEAKYRAVYAEFEALAREILQDKSEALINECFTYFEDMMSCIGLLRSESITITMGDTKVNKEHYDGYSQIII